MILKLLAAAVSIALCCSVAAAAPNGLNQIPIAKVFGDGGVAFSLAQSNLGDQTADVATSQFGVFNIAEFGLDYQATPSNERTLLGNAKLLVLHQPAHLPDIAVGLQNVATGQRAVPYVVATSQPRSVGLSIGAIRPAQNGYEGMAGVSVNVTPTVQIVADTIRGWSNYTSVGFIGSIGPFVTLNVAYAMPNNYRQNTNAYILNLSYIFHLRNGGVTHGKDLSKAVTPGPATSTSGTGSKNPAPGAGSK